MKTSYEGCHKNIAKSLKKGEHIPCLVWGDDSGNKDTANVCSYSAGEARPYGTNDSHVVNATPAPVALEVISNNKLMSELVKRDYKVDSIGDWILKVGSLTITLTAGAWIYCEETPSPDLSWEDWMLREVDAK